MGLELKTKALLKLNLKLFLDYAFIREGAYTNVVSGQLFYDGNVMSQFLPDTSAHNSFFGLTVGQVWQSPFRQFIYESGVALDGTKLQSPPILMSGVYVQGAFRPTNDPLYGHTIDYINGRIIFNNPISLSEDVHANFSYRDVRIGFERDFNQQFIRGFLESKYTTNTITSMQIVYPSGFAQPFPAVFIEVDDRDFEPYELGNRSLIVKDTVKLHIWSLDDLTKDNIVDILTSQARKGLPIIDFNKAPLPLSGIYNTLSNEYVPYQEMARNRELITTIGSGVPVMYYTFFEKTTARNIRSELEYERGLVIIETHTFNNAPTTPLGNSFGPISQLPTIEFS